MAQKRIWVCSGEKEAARGAGEQGRSGGNTEECAQECGGEEALSVRQWRTSESGEEARVSGESKEVITLVIQQLIMREQFSTTS